MVLITGEMIPYISTSPAQRQSQNYGLVDGDVFQLKSAWNSYLSIFEPIIEA